MSQRASSSVSDPIEEADSDIEILGTPPARSSKNGPILDLCDSDSDTDSGTSAQSSGEEYRPPASARKRRVPDNDNDSASGSGKGKKPRLSRRKERARKSGMQTPKSRPPKDRSGRTTKQLTDAESTSKEPAKVKEPVVPFYNQYPELAEDASDEAAANRDWNTLFQRFCIIAILRSHNAPPEKIKEVGSVPYLQKPYDRIKDRVRACANGILFDKTGAQGDISTLLAAYPLGSFDPTAFTDQCLRCLRHNGSRLEFYEYSIWGDKYDEGTFVTTPNPHRRSGYSWALGTTCFKRVTKGHKMYHRLYNTFVDFENDQVKTLKPETEAWQSLRNGDVDKLVAHFKQLRVNDGPLPRAGNVHDRASLLRTIETIRLRVVWEIHRRTTEYERTRTEAEKLASQAVPRPHANVNGSVAQQSTGGTRVTERDSEEED